MPNDKCTCCPYGPFIGVSLLLGIVSFCLTYAATFSCYFYITENDIASEIVTINYGIWSAERVHPMSSIETSGTSVVYVNTLSRSCGPYPEGFEADSAMKAARAFTMISVIVGAYLLLMMSLYSCCVVFPRNLFVGTGILCFVEAIFIVLSLVSLATVSCKQALSCKMSLLGILAIVASIMWVATGIYILMMPKNARGQPANSTTTVTHIPAKARAAPKEQARIEQRTEARYNPDGSTSQVMVTTTTKADGTQLVTEAPLQN